MISTVQRMLPMIFCLGGLFLAFWIPVHFGGKRLDGSVHGRYQVIGYETGQTTPWSVFATGEPPKGWADTEPTFVMLIFTSTVVVLLSNLTTECGRPKTSARLLRIGAMVFGSLMLIGWILHLSQPVELGSPGDFLPWRLDRCDPLGHESGDLSCRYKTIQEQPSFSGHRAIPGCQPDQTINNYDFTVCHLRPDYRPVQTEIEHAVYQLGAFLLVWLSVLCQSL